MKLFFDTSALVKYFHDEDGTEYVSGMIEAKDNDVWLSELARLEFLSVVYRRLRNREITETQASLAISGFEEEISFLRCEPLTHVTLKEAESLMKEYGKLYGLRTLDALQIAAFSLMAEEAWIFVSADTVMCKLVETMGFSYINPIDQR